MQATRGSIKESKQVKRIVRAKTSSIFFPLNYTFYRKSNCIFGFPVLYVCTCSSLLNDLDTLILNDFAAVTIKSLINNRCASSRKNCPKISEEPPSAIAPQYYR